LTQLAVHLLNLTFDFNPVESLSSAKLEILEPLPAPAPIVPNTPQKITKQAIRTSLQASTLDGVLAVIFSATTTGVLLTNFLLKLGATPIEIGLLSSIPMLVNLLQPVGAYIADRTTSRHSYCLWIFGISRLLWLILLLGIGWSSWSNTNLDPHQLVLGTLGIILATNILGALGSSAWFSWMAALVPPRLRGRYFGIRNSAASLTNLVCVPVLGFAVSAWPSGPSQGYGVVLLLGVVAGIASLGFQFLMVDVNPQLPQSVALYRSKIKGISSLDPEENSQSKSGEFSIFKDTNFLKFLFYIGLWTFAVSLSAPFFNLYLLDNLALDLRWATIYTSLISAANLVMLVLWGKLADRVGNRPLLLLVGIVVAVTPLFWLGAGTDSVSVWLWLPLIHLLIGGAGAAVDLCSSNIQMELAPVDRPSGYFAIAAAVAGICGGLGTTAGSFLAQLDYIGGLPGLFALSAVVRLIALLPLVFVREPRSQPVVQVMGNLLRFKPRLLPVQVPSKLVQTKSE
jgi:MFS family permease